MCVLCMCVLGHLVNFISNCGLGSKKFEKLLEGFLCSWHRQQVPAASPGAISGDRCGERAVFKRAAESDSHSVIQAGLRLLTHSCAFPYARGLLLQRAVGRSLENLPRAWEQRSASPQYHQV